MKNIKNNLLFIFIYLVIGFIAGTFVVYISDGSGLNIVLSSLLVLVFFILSLGLGIIFHELGHLVGGLISGYEFLSFRIANLVLVKYNTGYKLKRYSIPGTAGQCLMRPPKNREDFPYKLYNYGGWIANIMFAIIALLLYSLVKNNVFISGFLLIFSFLQIFFGLSNGIPMYIGLVANDGKTVQVMGENKDVRNSFWNLLEINYFLTNGRTYEEIPLEYLEMPGYKNYITSSIPSFKSLLLMEKENYEDALSLIKEVRRDWSVISVNDHLLKYDEMTCEILLGRDNPEELKSKIDMYLNRETKKLDKVFTNFLNRNRFWIVYYTFVEKDKKKVEIYNKRFNKIGSENPILGEVISEKNILENALKLVD